MRTRAEMGGRLGSVRLRPDTPGPPDSREPALSLSKERLSPHEFRFGMHLLAT